MHEAHDFMPLLIVTTVALVTVFISLKIRVMRIPIVVGEIIMGMIIGQSGLGLIPEEPGPWLHFLSLFGFTVLMFLSGLEINFDAVMQHMTHSEKGEKGKGGGNLTLALSSFGLCLLLSFIFSLVLLRMDMIQSPYIMTLILSTTSVGIVVPLLKERGEINSNLGQALLLSAVVADFATMFLITVLVAVIVRGGLTLDVVVIAALFIAFFAFVMLGRRFKKRRDVIRIYKEGATATAQIRVRSAMTVMLFFIVLSQLTGTEVILGAFLAGAVVSLLTQPGGGRLGMKLDAIGYGFLIPYFFIMVGARFDMSVLFSSKASILLLPLLVLIAFTVKLGPALIYRKKFGLRCAIAGGFLLSSRLSLIIAAASIGLEMNSITPAVHSAIILVAVITCLISPLIYNRLMGTTACASEKPADLEPLIGHLVNNPGGLHLKLAQVPLADKTSLIDHTLLQTRLRSRTGVTVIALIREDGIVIENPPADAELKKGDFLVVIGEEHQIRALETLDQVDRCEQPG